MWSNKGVKMAYTELEGKELVVKAGKMLVESGLIARTWGNISARISETQFVISPSGLAYDSLTIDDIVTVNIEDCSYEGNIKPSSEKGVHRDAYFLRADVNFIIHTHQVKATIISLAGKDIIIEDENYEKVLGWIVPCAPYGISSTKKLCKEVANTLNQYKDSKAILMKHHGALCLGKDMDNAFHIANTLEEVSEEKYKEKIKAIENNEEIQDYGRSIRRGNSFKFICNGKTDIYKINSVPKVVSKEVLIHWDIYRLTKVNSIIHLKDSDVVEFSKKGEVLKPYLDDLAQIAGVNIHNVDFKDIRNPFDKEGVHKRKMAISKLKNKNVLFLKDEGALCTGITNSDTKAVAMVLKKGCQAALYALASENINWLGAFDASVQRLVYVKKYSKIKKK